MRRWPGNVPGQLAPANCIARSGHTRTYHVDTLAPTVIGAGHLLFAGRKGAPPDPEAVRKVVTTVMVGVWPDPDLTCRVLSSG